MWLPNRQLPKGVLAKSDSFPWSISFVVTYTSITSHRPGFLTELDPLGFSGHQRCLFASSIPQGRQKPSGHSMKGSDKTGNVSVTLCSPSAPHSHSLYVKSDGIAARFYSDKLTVTFVAMFRLKVTRTFIFIRKNKDSLWRTCSYAYLLQHKP